MANGRAAMANRIPCPFVYAKGRKCTGHIVRVEAYKADITWTPDGDGRWRPSIGAPRSHYHLFCSEKGNHAGYGRSDSDQMKCYPNRLPDGLKLE
jgi:hypothetical protein